MVFGGKKWEYFYHSSIFTATIAKMGFLGEFEVKMDTKGRIKLPAALIRQIGDGSSLQFVVNRGFEDCLVLYTKEQWKEETKKLQALNPYDKKHRQFMRLYFRGATELVTDSSDRINLPKQLVAHADIQKDIILFAHLDKIEIWDKQKYEEVLSVDSDEYADLADEVMHFSKPKDNE